MFLNLPEELILEIFEYLDFADLGRVYCVCKNVPRVSIAYKVYQRETGYTNQTAHSYLLTNGPQELPGQIKNNFLEIKLYRGVYTYHFVFYKSIYRADKDMLDYLNHIEWKTTKKTIVSGLVKTEPDSLLK